MIQIIAYFSPRKLLLPYTSIEQNMTTEQNWKANRLELRDLVFFFLISFAWTWAFWSLFIYNILELPAGTGTSSMTLREMGVVLPIILVSPFGPTIAAFVMSYIRGGKNEIRKTLKRFNYKDVSRNWLITTIMVYPLIFLFVRLSSAILFQVSQPTPIWYGNPLIILPPFIASLLHGGLSEEIGWRGYALPRLQSRFNATTSSVILGFIEGLWHVPLVFWLGDSRYGMSIPLLVLWQMIATFYRTWIYNNTDGSLLAAVLFHAMGNTASDISPVNVPSLEWLPRVQFVPPYLFFVFSFFLGAILIIYGYKDMRRN